MEVLTEWDTVTSNTMILKNSKNPTNIAPENHIVSSWQFYLLIILNDLEKILHNVYEYYIRKQNLTKSLERKTLKAEEGNTWSVKYIKKMTNDSTKEHKSLAKQLDTISTGNLIYTKTSIEVMSYMILDRAKQH